MKATNKLIAYQIYIPLESQLNSGGGAKVGSEKVRLDKWLWACRFFKTRSLAKQEIDGGKVRVNGSKTKPSREVQLGDKVSFKQGWDEKIVDVIRISDQRRGAPEAQTLYQETDESIQAREKEAAQRKAAGASVLTEARPTKKQRRQIHRFKRIQIGENDEG